MYLNPEEPDPRNKSGNSETEASDGSGDQDAGKQSSSGGDSYTVVKEETKSKRDKDRSHRDRD